MTISSSFFPLQVLQQYQQSGAASVLTAVKKKILVQTGPSGATSTLYSCPE